MLFKFEKARLLDSSQSNLLEKGPAMPLSSPMNLKGSTPLAQPIFSRSSFRLTSAIIPLVLYRGAPTNNHNTIWVATSHLSPRTELIKVRCSLPDWSHIHWAAFDRISRQYPIVDEQFGVPDIKFQIRLRYVYKALWVERGAEYVFCMILSPQNWGEAMTLLRSTKISKAELEVVWYPQSGRYPPPHSPEQYEQCGGNIDEDYPPGQEKRNR